MTIETTLQIKLGEDSYTLIVKMIKIESTSYFFIRDSENEKPLLSGKVLELTYVDSFVLTEFGGVIKSKDIPKKLISIIVKEMTKNKKSLLY